MQVQVTKEKLDFALSSVSRVASSRAGLPILSNILLRTSGSRLLVAATNLEIASSHYIGAKVSKQGSITIPARLITEFIHNLPKEPIELEVKQHKLYISSKHSSSTINGVADDEFPELPTVDEKVAVKYSLSPQDFKQAVNQTIIAASNDSTRPVLTGVFWHSFEKKLYAAATDGYRLAEREITTTNSDVKVIIPTSSLQEVVRSMTDDVDEVGILLDESQISVTLNDITITSRLIDGNFPNYRQLIPSSSSTSFSIARDEFTQTIKIASLFARESGGGITLSVDIDKKQLKVHSIASEVGENTSETEVEVKGEGGSVSLNSRYLLDALGVIDSDSIEFEFSGKLAPCILRSATKNQNYTHIIMPLKS